LIGPQVDLSSEQTLSATGTKEILDFDSFKTERQIQTQGCKRTQNN